MVNPAEEGGEFPDGGDGGPDGGGGGPDDHGVQPDEHGVDGLVAAARQSDAALRRRRRRWREVRRSGERTVDDALIGAVGERVVGHLVGGAEVAGTLEVVGLDVARIDLAGRRCWVALREIAAVELASGRPGDPADRDDTTLGDVLDDLAAERTEVSIDLRSGTRLGGTLVAAGASVELRRPDRDDVVVVRPEVVASVTVRARR